MASTIGIKIANGEFYSLLEENSQVKKRLILTTVHDNQQSVQIDLYKSKVHAMADAVYIGSLVVEKIKPRPKGEPSIEMIVGSSIDGNINAEAVDLDSGPLGEHQYLSVSLRSLGNESQEYEIPDFELETNESPPSGLYDRAGSRRAKKSSGLNLAAVAIAVSMGLLILAAGIWYFIFWGKESADSGRHHTTSGQERHTQHVEGQGVTDRKPEEKPPVESPKAPAEQPPVQIPVETPPPPPPQPAEVPKQAPPPQVTEVPKQAPAQPQVIEAPKQAPAPVAVSRKRNPPVASYKVPAVIPKGGVAYRIRFGDTLWDISEAFYRTPWLYSRIARFNNIRNPDRIISGRTIRIPPRN